MFGNKPETVAAVISIFNEEKYMRNVIDAVLRSGLFDEIICVDDGSSDGSKEILKGYRNRITVISFEENRGKSYAMVAGVRAAVSDIIVFCDADLIGITKDHLLSLVEPIRQNLADQVLAIRQFDGLPFKNLTGERAYRRKDLLPHLDKMENKKFGVETYLNEVFSNERTYWIMTKGLMQAGKFDENFVVGYVKEGYEIVLEALRQKEIIPDKNTRTILRDLRDSYKEYLKRLEKYLRN
ncbi:glycosyltransferase family 2 protein [candidate division WWE3 bacterium]|uniref:Glycosyltransferase family 2 protein n=1 Tax=candidate division WWE3 bacterium TaxID=2053526 RepID=A0A955RRV2_UNCKA|nr:glycosyltransferase family 2 protein [candidate division WWE3 bacterium]